MATEQASVRLADRRVLQLGEHVGDVVGCATVDLTAAQVAAIQAALAAPNGGITIDAAGVVAALPFVAPAPPPDAVAFANAVAQLRATFGTARTLAQLNNSVDALTVVARRLFNELT